MLRLIDTFKDLAVLSLRTGGVIGNLEQPLINPNNLKIEGWYCQPRFQKGKLILVTQDIREIIPQGFIVDDQDVLVEPNDLVRLRKLIELGFELRGKKVVTVHGKGVGKVADYSLELESMYIQKLYVGQSIIRNINGGRTIDRQQIVEITDTRIVVKDTEIKSPAKASVLRPAHAAVYSSPAASASAAATEEYR